VTGRCSVGVRRRLIENLSVNCTNPGVEVIVRTVNGVVRHLSVNAYRGNEFSAVFSVSADYGYEDERYTETVNAMFGWSTGLLRSADPSSCTINAVEEVEEEVDEVDEEDV